LENANATPVWKRACVCEQEAHVGNKAVQWAIQNGMW
jgi:hypothetical protein